MLMNRFDVYDFFSLYQSPKSDWLSVQFLIVGAQLCMMLMNSFGVYFFFILCQSLQSDWLEDGEVIVSSPGHLHPVLLFHHMKNYM
jgi:hypothetical protein